MRPVWLALLLLLMVVICVLAFIPRPPGLQFAQADKLHHLAAFMTLAACATLSLPAGWRSDFAVLLTMLAFGVFIEAIQMHLPDRSAEWQDVVADVAGALLGMLLVLAARRFWPRPQRLMHES